MMKRLPNIVFILADDMGYGDLSCQNPESKIQTPNLDRLAAGGMRFTDAHASSAVCTPSRYAILTGRYCWRSRLKSGVLWGYSEHLIEQGRMTVASMLKGCGYHTACVGKWHLGWDWQKRDDADDLDKDDPTQGVDFRKPILNGPTSVGFDWFYGIAASLDMPPYCYVENDRPTAIPDDIIEDSPWNAFWRRGPIAPDFRHREVLPHLTEKAVNYIRQRGSDPDTPFFLYFPLPAPHTPILPTEQFQGCSGAGDYGDFCVQVDAVVGQVMEALDSIGATENTLVIFTSDNGPEVIAYERARTYKHYSMGPLRGLKRDTWEGGHRIPFIAHWPERIQPGSVSHQVISLVDLLATAADIAGVSLPQDAGEDSLSILPVLQGEAIDRSRREAIVYHSHDGEFAIRQGDWVFIDAPTGDNNGEPEWLKKERGYESHSYPGELYHLNDDLAQSRNLYGDYPEKVKELKALLERYKAEGRSVRR